MADAALAGEHACQIAKACVDADWPHCGAMRNTLLQLPPQHLHLICSQLLGAASVEILFTQLPVPLHRPLIAAMLRDQRTHSEPTGKHLSLAVRKPGDESPLVAGSLRASLSAAARGAISVQVPTLPPLAGLDLEVHSLAPDELASLLSVCAGHTGLTYLDLRVSADYSAGDSQWTEGALGHVIGAALPQWPLLRHLALPHMTTSEDDDAVLAGMLALSSLTHLNLDDSCLTDRHSIAAAAAALTGLRHLVSARAATFVSLTGADFAALPRLTCLDMADRDGYDASESDGFMAALCASTNLKSLAIYADLCNWQHIWTSDLPTGLQCLRLHDFCYDTAIDPSSDDDEPIPVESRGIRALPHLCNLTCFEFGLDNVVQSAAFTAAVSVSLRALPLLRDLRMHSRADQEQWPGLCLAIAELPQLHTLQCSLPSNATLQVPGRDCSQDLSALCELQIELAACISDDLAGRLLQMRSLRSLAISVRGEYGGQLALWATFLQGCSTMTALEALQLRCCNTGALDVMACLCSLSMLTMLRLYSCTVRINPDPTSYWPPRLVDLSLVKCGLSGAQLSRLVFGSVPARVRVLRLQGNEWSTAEDAQAALLPALSWLRESCLTRLVLPAQCAHSKLDAFNDRSGGAQGRVVRKSALHGEATWAMITLTSV